MADPGVTGPDRPAPPAAATERVVARLRPHARILFFPALLLIASVGAIAYFFGSFPEAWQNWAVLGGGVLVILLGCVLPYVNWMSVRYVITTRRLIVRRGFFVRVRQELYHARGYGITVHRTWLQSAFRSGNVRVTSGGELPVVLRDVPSAVLVQNALHELVAENQSIVAPYPGASSSMPTTNFGSGFGGGQTGQAPHHGGQHGFGGNSGYGGNNGYGPTGGIA
ncbi:PH domain-containing protein [Plantibacter sp. YIM 135249]|uniref:PH domain-containing protein n=1 Tax=Plantibacter sp. YIM 135249 TaxID=3423918 RepID=UPI003D354AF2